MEKRLIQIRSRIRDGSLFSADYFATLDCDAALDARDNNSEFESDWQNLFEEVQRQWRPSVIEEPLREFVEELRRESFRAISAMTDQHEIASYVSDDIDLIVRARLLSIEATFVEELWAAYDRGAFPYPH